MKRNRVSLFVALALVLALLAGCGQTAVQSAPASEAQSAPASVSVSEPESAAALPDDASGAQALALVPGWPAYSSRTAPADDPDVPDFLTPDQQDLFRAARRLYDGIAGCSRGFDVDYATVVAQPVEGQDFTRSFYLDNGFASYDDFLTALHAVFTDEMCNSILANGDFIEVDGKLYAGEGDRGSNIAYLSNSYTAGAATSDGIAFTWAAHYNDDAYENPDSMDAANAYTEEYTVQLAYTENGWRFFNFVMPY